MNRNTRPFSIKKIVSGFVLVFCVFTMVFGQSGNAPVSSLPQFPGPLAIDGFLQRQGAAGDWVSGPGGANNVIFTDAGIPLIPLCFHLADKYNSASDEVFSKGYLQDDPNTMKWKSGKATSKTDLNNILFYLALNPADNHIWIVMGADRRSTGKNSTIDFEFLQSQVLMTGDINTGQDRGFYSAGPNGGRTVGDLVISVAFENSGGSFATISYFQWQPTATPGTYRYFSITPPAGTAFTATNSVSINVPFGAFGSTTYPPATFIETAVTLTALIGGAGGEGGGPFGSIWVKSKSNDNFDDFFPPIQFASTIGSLSVSYFFYDLYTAQLNANIAPLNPNDYNFHWTAIGATNGTFVDPSVTGTLNNYNIPDPIFSADTNYNCISYIYKVTVSPKSNPGSVIGQTYVVINSPCKIGKPINPDQMHQSETSAEENSNAEDLINVFPNPARSASTITLGGNNGFKDIHLINMNGSIVQRWSGITTNTLRLKDLPQGIYLLKVFSRTTGKTETKKIIVNN